MNESRYYFRDTCRMCNSNQLKKTVSLTPTPPGNDFLTELVKVGFKESKHIPLTFGIVSLYIAIK